MILARPYSISEESFLQSFTFFFKMRFPFSLFPKEGEIFFKKKTAQQFHQGQFKLKAGWLVVECQRVGFKPLSNWGQAKCQGEVAIVQQSELFKDKGGYQRDKDSSPNLSWNALNKEVASN